MGYSFFHAACQSQHPFLQVCIKNSKITIPLSLLKNSSKNYTVKIFILFLLFNEKRLAFCTQAIVDDCHWRQE
jgi:hypothetical protein